MCARRLGAALALGVMFVAAPAAGQEALTVRLEAPDAVRPLLEAHVRLLKRDTLALPEQQADRVAMTRRARREIADLLATEGFFSPRIRFNRDDPANWVLEVEPGLRTEIAAVEIAFTGDLAVSGEGGQEYLDLLRASWGLPVGQPFRQSAWDGAKAALLDAVSARTYAAARIAESRAEIDPGKTLEIRLQAVGETTDDGEVKVFFELNGQPRRIKVPDRAHGASGSAVRRKAETGNTAQLGAPRSDGSRTAHYHAGCGIVADSDPAGEVAETHAKTRAFAQLVR